MNQLFSELGKCYSTMKLCSHESLDNITKVGVKESCQNYTNTKLKCIGLDTNNTLHLNGGWNGNGG